MKKEFINYFFETRDETLQEIKESSYNWNKFINYWSKILDEYSVDNVLNLYSYNPYGKIFKTFKEKLINKNINININSSTSIFQILAKNSRERNIP